MLSHALRRLSDVVKYGLRLRQIGFFLGVVGAVVIFLGSVATYNVVFDATLQDAHRAELEYATHSLADAPATGGLVIPASCDSGVSHFAGDLANCMSWTPYCSGAPNWEWREYSDTEPPRQDRYIRPGDGGCVPPAVPADPGGLWAACTNHTAVFNWNTPAGTTDFRLRVHDNDYNGPFTCGTTGQWCWPETNGGYPGSGHTIAGLYGSRYTWWVHACNASGCSPGIGGNAINCADPVVVPTPTDTPTGLTASCAIGGNSVSVAWNPVPGATRYLPRIVGVTSAQCSAIGWSIWIDGVTCYTDYFGYTGGTIGITPDTDLSFWVAATNDVTVSGVAAVAIKCPSAPIPYKPAPDAVTKTCAADGASVTIDWTDVPGANRYLPRIGGITQAQCAAIHWSWFTDNYTCYYDNWSPAWGSAVTLPLNIGGTHRFWVHTGDPIDPAWPAASTGDFTCPVQSNPAPSLSVSCNGSTAATANWTGPTPYHLRVAGLSQSLCTMPGWVWDTTFNICKQDNASGNTQYLPALTGGSNYTFQVYYGSPSTYMGTSFNCSAGAAPIGALDDLVCDASGGVIKGWTCDADKFDHPLDVDVYVDANTTATARVTANITRSSTAPSCGGFTAHEYQFAIPTALRDGASHSYRAYALDINAAGTSGGATNPLLGGAAKSVTCPVPTTPTTTPDIQLGVTTNLVAKKESAALWWRITGAVDMSCTLTGGGMNTTINHTAGATTVQPATPSKNTPPILNATTFTLACQPAGPTTAPATKSVRVEVVPSVEEI